MFNLSIEDDQGNRTEVNLVRDEYTLGRAEENNIRLTERNVSRHHAKLHKSEENGGWLLEDLKSYNGCYVNGVRVSRQCPLTHGDLVQLGDYRLELVDEELEKRTTSKGRASAQPIPQRQTLTGQPDRLVMLVGPTPGAEFPLSSERCVLGRGEECDISVNHASVSRVHAEINALGDGRYEILDLNSANGVRINGVELQRSLIDARDTIELGDVVVKFIPAGQIFRPGVGESLKLGVVEPSAATTTPPSGAMARALSRVPGGAKTVAGLVGVLVLFLLVVSLGSSSSEDEATGQTAAGGDAAQLLEQALELLNSGDVDAAREKAEQIPSTSNVRKSAKFKQIQARWADTVLQRAKDTDDEAVKRALLMQIVRSKSVDSIRRSRANDLLSKLGGGGIDIADLPSSTDRSHKTNRRGPVRPARQLAQAREADEAAETGEPEPVEAEEQQKETAPQKTPTKHPVKKKALVRSNPFE